MNELTEDHRLILCAIAKLGERANWHKVGRLVLGKLSSPGVFESVFSELLDWGLIVELKHPGETLHRLSLTDAGRTVVDAK